MSYEADDHDAGRAQATRLEMTILHDRLRPAGKTMGLLGSATTLPREGLF